MKFLSCSAVERLVRSVYWPSTRACRSRADAAVGTSPRRLGNRWSPPVFPVDCFGTNEGLSECGLGLGSFAL